MSLFAAQRRAVLEPQLWRMASNAAERVTASVRRDLEHPERVAWLLAEDNGRLMGAANVRVIPAPPIYTLGEGGAGLIGDDTFVREDAPAGTLEALLEEAETFMRAKGAVVMVAACPQGWSETQAVLKERGYGPLTLWMVKPEAGADGAMPGHVRKATEEDVPQIVELNRQAQDRKREASARFWTPHPEAPQRFQAWMGRSLTLADRDLLVLMEGTRVTGFAIAQPANLPPAHDGAHVGLLDDFHAHSFGGSLREGRGDHTGAASLLTSAEQTLRARGRTTVLAVCPAAWTIKRDFLAAQGYHTANLWLLKS